MAETLLEEPEDDTVTSRRMDEELKAISAILRTLNELDEAASSRIVAYISARFVKA